MSEGQYGPSYSLYGVICHAGSGPISGHYYGHVKGANGQWYEMNDESVTATRAPIGMKSAYMLFYIRDKGQALEAAVSRAPVPSRNGIAAGMKKRKVVDGEDEGHGEDTGVKTARPFIGPQLPSPASDAASGPASQPILDAIDPQADSLKKKIAAAPKAKVTQALQSLSQYDDDSDKEGNAPNGHDAATPDTKATPSSTPVPPPSSPATPSSIPSSSFYHSSNHKGKKRKSLEGEADENKHSHYNDWARKPLPSPRLAVSSPHFQHRNQSRKPSIDGGNPFNRLVGSNNLHSTSFRLPVTYKNNKKRRLLM
jgi:ubiquitin carboxyl-terminal hydrolase 36/42